MDLAYLQTGISGVFFGFWISKICTFLELLRAAVFFFGLLDKCCIFKCFIFLTVFFGSSYIHQVIQWSRFPIITKSCLTFAKWIAFCRVFFRFCFSESIFWVFCQWQSIFWVGQEYPTPLIPVCRFIKSTPWNSGQQVENFDFVG